MYDNKIAELNQSIKKIRKEIEETEEAMSESKLFSEDLEKFVADRKAINNKYTGISHLKSFSGLLNKASGILSGTEYSSVKDKISGAQSMISKKLIKLREDLDYLEKELARAKSEQHTVGLEFEAFLNSEKEKNEQHE